jgi:hypothetical protein
MLFKTTHHLGAKAQYVAICVFSSQFSILIIVGLIGPNRGHIPEYIGLRLGPRLLCHVNHRFLTGISHLQKVPATSDLLKFVLGRHAINLV